MSNDPHVWEFNLEELKNSISQEDDLVQAILDDSVIVVWETNIWDQPDLIEELLRLTGDDNER